MLNHKYGKFTLKPCIWSGYVLLYSKDCILAEMRVTRVLKFQFYDFYSLAGRFNLVPQSPLSSHLAHLHLNRPHQQRQVGHLRRPRGLLRPRPPGRSDLHAYQFGYISFRARLFKKFKRRR